MASSRLVSIWSDPRPVRAQGSVAGVVAEEVAGADAAEEVVGAVAAEEVAPKGDVPSGSQSAQLSLELPPLGVGDLGGRVGFVTGGITTMFMRFTQRSSKPELGPWSLMW